MIEKVILSVIVPVYNVEKYLERCLDSILAQTYTDYEVICVDDGSTDDSLLILKKYAGTNSKIKYIHKKNGGLVSARKAGMNLAKGKYATYVDSDDWIESNMYQEMIKEIQDIDADVITSGCIRDYGNHCLIENESMEPGIYYGKCLDEKLLANMIATDLFYKSNISLHVYNKIYKTDLVRKYQNQVNNYINVGEDAACVYPCILNANKIVVTGKNYYHYCLRNNSIMGTRKKDELERFEILFDNLVNEGKKHLRRVPNLNTQYMFLKYYEILLQQAQHVIRYEHNVLFPFGEISREDRVVIFGAGRFGIELKHVLEEEKLFKVVAWIDKSEKEGTQSIEHIKEINFDRVIIAALIYDVVEQMRKELQEIGIGDDRIMAVDYHLFE